MIVREIVRKRNKVNIFFDNNECIQVPYDIYVKNVLCTDEEITEKELDEIKYQADIYLIKHSSFRYLALRNHSKYELRIKLNKKGYNKERIDFVLSDLSKYNYLNDLTFAENYFQYQLTKKKGKLKIISELYKKGINREIVNEISKKYDNNQANYETACEIGIKKFNKLKLKNYQNIQIKQKLYLFLANKGFTSDTIFMVVSKIMKDDDE